MTRAILLVLLLSAIGGAALYGRSPAEGPSAPIPIPAVAAVGVRLDTLLIGGYTEGRFVDAVRSISSDLSEEERLMVGQHLDRIFGEGIGEDRVEGRGRLRVAYERAVRPDGSTRSIRVLGAELASSGRLHTAFYFERAGRPGYFDPLGAAVHSDVWAGPLATLRVSSPFGGRRMHPILRRVLPHTGVDYAAPAGEPVRATADGIVAAAGSRGGYGLLVELSHPNGYGTRYAHLQRIAPGIAPARLVRQGEVVGYVGMTGLATGPHLHYEVRRRGQPVDPSRIDVASGLGSGLASDIRWNRERRLLTNLLARTPTMLNVN